MSICFHDLCLETITSPELAAKLGLIEVRLIDPRYCRAMFANATRDNKASAKTIGNYTRDCRKMARDTMRKTRQCTRIAPSKAPSTINFTSNSFHHSRFTHSIANVRRGDWSYRTFNVPIKQPYTSTKILQYAKEASSGENSQRALQIDNEICNKCSILNYCFWNR